MKRILGVSVFLLLMIVSFVGVTYSYEYPDSQTIRWEIIGNEELVLDINSQYIEYGVVAYKGDVEVTDLVFIDTSSLDMSHVGEYKVKYSIVDSDGIMEYIYRKVKVVDKEAPVITLKGDLLMEIDINSEYMEPGYEVTDNKDKDLEVKINGEVNTTEAGEYTLKYSVIDSDKKEASVERKIIVK